MESQRVHHHLNLNVWWFLLSQWHILQLCNKCQWWCMITSISLCLFPWCLLCLHQVVPWDFILMPYHCILYWMVCNHLLLSVEGCKERRRWMTPKSFQFTVTRINQCPAINIIISLCLLCLSLSLHLIVSVYLSVSMFSFSCCLILLLAWTNRLSFPQSLD